MAAIKLESRKHISKSDSFTAYYSFPQLVQRFRQHDCDYLLHNYQIDEGVKEHCSPHYSLLQASLKVKHFETRTKPPHI